MSDKLIDYRNDRRAKEVIRERLFVSLTGDKTDKKTVFGNIKRMSTVNIALMRIEQV